MVVLCFITLVCVHTFTFVLPVVSFYRVCCFAFTFYIMYRRGQSKMLAFLLIVVFHEIILGAEEHAYQQFIECAFDSQGQVDHTWRYGYDGKDIMHVDLVKKAVVATSEPGKMLEEERKHMEYIKRKEEKLKMVCSAVKTVFLKSNNSLSRAAKPAVLLSAGGKQDQKYLKCVVHGFYPNVIRVRWTQKGRPVYFGVSSTGILPHRDGTFQMTSYLSLINMSAHGLTCETEHLSLNGILRKIYEEESQITEHVLWAMAAFVPGFALPVFLTLLFILKRRHTTKPPEDTSDRSEASLSLNLMNMSQET